MESFRINTSYGSEGEAIEHTEFKLGVTVWSLETEDGKPSDEILAICRLLDADELAVSPAEMYPRADPLVLRSKADPKTFLAIDLTEDPTDQMEVVGLAVRCDERIADAIQQKLKVIRECSDIKTALLRGNLGLPSF